MVIKKSGIVPRCVLLGANSRKICGNGYARAYKTVLTLLESAV